MTPEQRRHRLATRHFLAGKAPDVFTAAGAMVGLHSSDPATVYLSSRARVAEFTPEQLDAALYEHRSLVRIQGMRRTLFVVPADLAPIVNSACTKALGPAERRRLARMVEEQGIASDGARFVGRVAGATRRALDNRGEATAGELRADVPELSEKLSFGEGKSWAGTVGISTRILFLLATEGKVIRGRPGASWTSSRYRWATTEHWLGASFEEMDERAARSELARRWLSAYGPATRDDLRWWAGWTVRNTLAALEGCDAIEVDLNPGVGYVLRDDIEVDDVEPWAAFLPSLDPTVMGWKDREWYLGPHAARLFDRNGNAGPTVWWDGHVVGGWAQTPSGDVAYRLLEDLGSEAERTIEREAAELQRWLARVVVKPRFRTPLERELSG